MKILLFAGTTEGRFEALQRRAQGHEVLVCVATEDGRHQLPEDMPCLVGRLDLPAMVALARKAGAECIVDATHPFARVVSENARACARTLHIPYERIQRASDEQSAFADAVTWVENAEAAATLLAGEHGNVFLSTGSNTVAIYTSVLTPERIFVRVLPNCASIEKCLTAHVPPAHIMAMQGPFTAALNAAVYAQWDIAHLVTKDSGDVGGVKEKVLPALEAGIHVVMIRRPKQE